MNLILLHTHSIMAFVLALTQLGMLVYLYQLRENTLIRRWLLINYGASVIWQLDQTLRFSLNPAVTGTLPYKLETAFIYGPALAILELSYFQILYLFLYRPFEHERRMMTRLLSVLAVGYMLFNGWNEFGNKSHLLGFQGASFVFGLLVNSWALIVCLRKAHALNGLDQPAVVAHKALALVNAGFIFMCLVAVVFGFYTPVGYWTFFIFIWLCNLGQIIIYISYSAVPVSFQVKIAGFSFVSIVTFLAVVTLVFFPPLIPTDVVARLPQQAGLAKMFAIIIGAALFVVLVLPGLLRRTLTHPVQRLLAGVQRVNKGDLTTQVPVGSLDEIGNLTTQFNQMTQSLLRAQDQLREYAETLENKVVERTADLKQSLDNLRITQAQLIQAEKMASLGELTAGIAHEIQNPINFVNNFAELSIELLAELQEEQQMQKRTADVEAELMTDLSLNLQKITNHGKRASAIVKGMLEHSRPSSGEKQPTDVNRLTNEYFKVAYQGLLAKNKEFKSTLLTDFDPNLDKVNLAPQEIGRVLVNLFNNAFYAVQQKNKQAPSSYQPTVWVTTRQIDNKLEIRVRDNGIGIPETVKKKIFQPFFTTKPTGQGTGLGLSLSYDIVAKGHNGVLNAESQEGVGTEMIIQLPMHS